MVENILFVCTGNTCRSPMAEGFFNRLARARGLSVHALSCGLSVFESLPASSGAVAAAGARGVDLTGHTARQVTEALVASADMVYGMTGSHVEWLRRTFPQYAERIVPLCDDIPDPFGGSDEDYDRAADAIETAVEQLLGRLLR